MQRLGFKSANLASKLVLQPNTEAHKYEEPVKEKLVRAESGHERKKSGHENLIKSNYLQTMGITDKK